MDSPVAPPTEDHPFRKYSKFLTWREGTSCNTTYCNNPAFLVCEWIDGSPELCYGCLASQCAKAGKGKWSVSPESWTPLTTHFNEIIGSTRIAGLLSSEVKEHHNAPYVTNDEDGDDDARKVT